MILRIIFFVAFIIVSVKLLDARAHQTLTKLNEYG